MFLLLCVSAAMYGLFQFRLRDFAIMTCVVVGGYAAVILLQLFALFATFVQFSWVGGYIAGLRDKVRDKNKELATRNADLEKALLRIEELAMRARTTPCIAPKRVGAIAASPPPSMRLGARLRQ